MQLIILDRDGVINEESRAYIKNPNEFIPIPGSLEAIAQLTAAGFKIAVATNQAGVARKKFSLENLHAIHAHMQKLVNAHGGNIELICFCSHHPDEACHCRKPNVGMLEQIEQHFDIDLMKLKPRFAGDSYRDLVLGMRKGCIPTLVTTGDGQTTLTELTPADKEKVEIFPNLAAVVKMMLN